MTYSVIQTSQAPDAKPVGLSVTLTTDWVTIIDVPSYEIPELIFGGDTVVVPGVAEVISPLLLSNKSTETANVSIRVGRFNEDSNTTTFFILTNEIPVPAYDMLPIPMNGQFIYTGDVLQVKASALDSVDATISFTLGQAETDDVS